MPLVELKVCKTKWGFNKSCLKFWSQRIRIHVNETLIDCPMSIHFYLKPKHFDNQGCFLKLLLQQFLIL